MNKQKLMAGLGTDFRYMYKVVFKDKADGQTMSTEIFSSNEISKEEALEIVEEQSRASGIELSAEILSLRISIDMEAERLVDEFLKEHEEELDREGAEEDKSRGIQNS